MWLKALVASALFMAFVLAALYFMSFQGAFSDKQEVWAQFGDYLGGILNPIFALTALFALLYTIVLQSRELRDSAEQLRKSALALIAQNEVLERQAFENTFFQLLTLLGSVTKGLKLTIRTQVGPGSSASVFEDKQCLKELHKFLLRDFIHKVDRGDYLEPRVTALAIEYGNFYGKYGHLVGHYFRTIYRVIDFVDSSSITDNRKRFYVSLVRAQLTKHELGLLLYNCLSDLGNEKFLPLVARYQVLKHLEDEVLARPSDRDLAGDLLARETCKHIR